MTNTLGCQRSSVLRAIAPVAGGLRRRRLPGESRWPPGSPTP